MALDPRCVAPADKTIKLWRVQEKKLRAPATHATPRQTNVRGAGPRASGITSESLSVPRLYVTGSVVSATPKRVYSNVHAYHINSLSVNSDGQTFLSADDLRVNLWSLEDSQRAFSEYPTPAYPWRFFTHLHLETHF